MPINDNHFDAGEPIPDAHGQAALLLVESLIHGLNEQSVLSIGEAIDVVETAIDVQADIADAADGSRPAMRKSLGLLAAISDSLKQAQGRPHGNGEAKRSDGDGREWSDGDGREWSDGDGR